MAEIPVERNEKSGFPWWLIPLLIILLLVPLLYFCNKSAVVDNTNSNNANRIAVTTTGADNSAGRASAGRANNEGGSTSGGNTGANSAANSGMTSGNSGAVNAGGTVNSGAAITDVNYFGTATDKASLVGRGVTLSGVRVNRVLSDKVFTVKSGAGEMFVMLDDNLDSSGGKEQQIKMKPGQNVNLGGAFRNVPTGEVTEETKQGGLNKNEYAQMKGQNVYLHATSVSDVK